MAKLIDITGKAISGEWGTDDLVGNGVPVLRTTNFTNIGIVNFNNVVTRQIEKKSISEKLLRYGDIIIEKSGGSDKQPVGRVVFFEGEDNKYLFNNFTGLLRVRDFCKWNPKYIFYSLFANYVKGGTIPFENRTTGLHNLQTDSYVNSVMIMERKIEEQTDIVTILDKVNQLVNYEKKQLEDLDILVKSRFIEMFGDPVSNPKGWILKKLSDLGQFKNGINFHFDDAGIEIYCLGVGNFKNNDVLNNMKELSLISLSNLPSEEYFLHDNDIVFVRSNGNKALVGRCLAVYPGEVPVIFSGFCIRFRKNDDSILIPYLLHILKCESVRRKLTGRGANIQNLNQQILGNLIIPLPPLELQNRFATFVIETDKSKLVIQQSLDELETLKKSLMQQYFG